MLPPYALAYKSDDCLPLPANLCTLVYSEARVQSNESLIFEGLDLGIDINNTSSLRGGAPCAEARSNSQKKQRSGLLNIKSLIFLRELHCTLVHPYVTIP